MSKRKPHEPRKRPDPQVRVSADGALVDGIDRYARAVVGLPPHNFAELIQFAKDLLPVAKEACGVDDAEEGRTPAQLGADRQKVRDTMLLAAWVLTETANDGEGENPAAFIQRARQVIDWCAPKTQEVTRLDLMENKSRELGRLLGTRLARHEGFVLTIFDQGKGGHSSWISSVDRVQAIELLGGTLEAIKADQARHS